MAPAISTLLVKLTIEQKIVFAALACEKMYPLYEVFSSLNQWGDPKIYSEGIVILYNFVLTGSDKSYDVILEDVESIMPDLDDFSGTAPSYALDACSALAEAISFLIDYKDEHIINCSTACTDTVDMYVQIVHDLDQNSSDLNAVINSDFIMIREVERQVRVATALTTIKRFTTEKLAEIRLFNGKEEIVDLATIT